MRIGAPIAWGVASVLLVVLWGIPTKHDLLFVWLGLGMAALFFQEVGQEVHALGDVGGFRDTGFFSQFERLAV